ncbi:MAG: hypothetical protein H6827_00160 [Planctomycetes bacterium]|nr:hypothetical protein [Planctomycetota bacterium]
MVFLISKCFFLASTRAGWVLMACNILYETGYKRLGLRRFGADAMVLPLAVTGWWLSAGASYAAGFALVLGLAWGWASMVDSRWRSGGLAHQHRVYRNRAVLPVPNLIVQIRGPVLERRRGVDEMGVLVAGETLHLEVIVLNPSRVVPQLPLVLEARCDVCSLAIVAARSGEMPAPEPGESLRLALELQAVSPGTGGSVFVQLRHGDWSFKRQLRVREVVPRESARPTGVVIRRWRYGCRGAFAWRGDHDLFDPAAFQSIEGWRIALGLSRRFQLPSTLFLSSRLSLVEEEHRAYCAHFGWDRRSAEMPAFIEFVRQEVELRVEMEWPWQSARPLYAELGNHMHLHYGTEAAAAAENDWQFSVAMGSGRYAWMTGAVGDSFSEQRDNARANNALFRELFDYEAASYAIPSDVYDEHTPGAMEAAGLEVGSDTDASRFTRVFQLPPPHHPAGCERFVELTRKYPRDPQDAYQVATLKYWLHAARRTGRAFIFLSHHHLLQYEGVACYHMTEELLRSVLEDCDGDVHAATVGGLGRYWRDVLSETTRVVSVRVKDGLIEVENRGARDLKGLPLEFELAGGGQGMRLMDVRAGETRTLDLGAESGGRGAMA